MIEPGTILPRRRLTPEACRDLLKYIAPILAGATEVRGDFSIEVDRWRFPLADPAAGEGSGRLIISSLDVEPGPLVAELASRLKVPAKLLVVEDAPVTFRMADGRIHHGDLAFRIEGLTVRTHGSVGRGRVAGDGGRSAHAQAPPGRRPVGRGLGQTDADDSDRRHAEQTPG